MTETRSSSNLLKTVALRVGLGIPIIALVVIAPSGKWDYWQGWMYMGTLILPMIFTMTYFFKHDPGLLERRMRMREKEAAQRIGIAPGIVVGRLQHDGRLDKANGNRLKQRVKWVVESAD